MATNKTYPDQETDNWLIPNPFGKGMIKTNGNISEEENIIDTG